MYFKPLKQYLQSKTLGERLKNRRNEFKQIVQYQLSIITTTITHSKKRFQIKLIL